MTIDETEAARAPFGRRFERELEVVLLEQGEQLATLIEAEDFPLSAFLDRTKLEETLESLWTVVISHFATLTLNELEASKSTKVDLWTIIVSLFIQREAGALIKLIDDTTLKLVKSIIEAGVSEGLGMIQIAKNLRKEWPEASKFRAERIARTEIIRANNYGAIQGANRMAEQTGLQFDKVWMAANDSRTRESHAAADGQRVPLDGFFIIGGYEAQYPGDSSLPPEETIQCRCATSFVPVEEKSWRDLRDAKIRSMYPTLLKQFGQIQAIDEIADDVALSARQVKRILYQGVRG